MKHKKSCTSIQSPSFDDILEVAGDLRMADYEELSVTRDPSDSFSLAVDAFRSFYLRAAYRDSKPMLVFGAVRPSRDSPNVQVWAFGRPGAKSVLRAVTKYILRVMIPALLNDGVIYAQAISHPSNKVAHRWLEFLGFMLKATVPGIGPRKEDMILFTAWANVLKRNTLSAA